MHEEKRKMKEKRRSKNRKYFVRVCWHGTRERERERGMPQWCWGNGTGWNSFLGAIKTKAQLKHRYRLIQDQCSKPAAIYSHVKTTLN